VTFAIEHRRQCGRWPGRGSAHREEGPDNEPEEEAARDRTHRGQNLRASVFDEIADRPALAEIQVTKTFSGDSQGEGSVRSIQASRRDGRPASSGLSASAGRVAGRQGSFLLRDSGTLTG